jgi:hypothetical protein
VGALDGSIAGHLGKPFVFVEAGAQEVDDVHAPIVPVPGGYRRPVTAAPSEPPNDGPAVEQPPINGEWHPQVTVYNRLHGPALWIYWPDRWTLATVTSKHVYPGRLTIVHVELAMPNQDGTTSLVIRSFAWGPDNIRPA